MTGDERFLSCFQRFPFNFFYTFNVFKRFLFLAKDFYICGVFHVSMCIVWGWSPSLHHYHQLIWNRAEPRRPFQAVPTLWQTQSWRTSCPVTCWWLWAGQGRCRVLQCKYAVVVSVTFFHCSLLLDAMAMALYSQRKGHGLDFRLFHFQVTTLAVTSSYGREGNICLVFNMGPTSTYPKLC